MRLSQIHVPCTLVAGTYDVLAGAADMRSAAARLSDAVYVELRGSHFLSFERPTEVHRLLLDFLARVASP